MDKRIKKLIADPAYARRMRLATLKQVLDEADAAYYHTSSPLMDDKLYDTLRETYIARAGPDEAASRKRKVGAAFPDRGEDGVAPNPHPSPQPYPPPKPEDGVAHPPPKQKARVTTIKLPVFMSSLDKLKNDPKLLARWARAYPGPYHLRVKLDGMSVLYWRDARSDAGSDTHAGGTSYHLASRHEGTVGGDMGDRLFPYLRLPPLRAGELVRGELIVPKAVFDARHRGEGRQSIRACIAGLVGSKAHFDEGLARDVHFVAYEFMPSPTEALPFSQQLAKLRRRGFPHVVDVVATPGPLTMEFLESTFRAWRADHPYEMDGVVFSNDAVHAREAGRNPKYALAFKMDCEDQMADTEVVAVHWNPSRFGVLCPQIEVRPVRIAASTYTYCSGKHARFIVDAGIGPGARVRIIRANDVIPDVQAVLAAAPGGGALPDGVPFHWVSDVLIAEDAPSEERAVQVIVHFWAHLGAQHFSDKSVRKLYDAGFKTLRQWVDMRAADIEGLPGVQARTAAKWVQSMQAALGEATLDRVLNASSVFGRGVGSRRLKWVFDALFKGRPNQGNPDVDPLVFFRLGDTELHDALTAVDGIGKEVAAQVLAARGAAREFWDATFPEDWQAVILDNTRRVFGKGVGGDGGVQVDGDAQDGDACKDLVVLMTGFRDDDLKNFIVRGGGAVAATFNKKVNLVLVKTEGTKNGKTDRAKREGIPVQTADAFLKSRASKDPRTSPRTVPTPPPSHP